MSEVQVSVALGQELINDLAKHPKCVSDKLFRHLINPLKKGNPKSHLEGRYKPSWVDQVSSVKQAFANLAKANNLHHYHFGHPFYQHSNDRNYPGKTSDAIAHIKLEESSTSEHHIVYDIDLTHNPFNLSFNFNQPHITFTSI